VGSSPIFQIIPIFEIPWAVRSPSSSFFSLSSKRAAGRFGHKVRVPDWRCTGADGRLGELLAAKSPPAGVVVKVGGEVRAPGLPGHGSSNGRRR
jgi:hypothetical protein